MPKSETKTFRGYDDFVPAYNAARAAIAVELGANWHLFPTAYQWARVPAPWASCKVFGRTSKAPRDMRLPAARYWPTGKLPVGPEYAPVSIGQIRQRRADLIAQHRALVTSTRAHWNWAAGGDNEWYRRANVNYLAELARIRRAASVAEAA